MEAEVEVKIEVMKKIKKDLITFYPKAILLFGSMARHLFDEKEDMPNDLDFIFIGNNFPFSVVNQKYECDFEIHVFKEHQIVNIAKSLRYDSKPVALSKLYSKVLVKQHSKDVIVACLLMGPSYNDFGIEQIEVDSKIDQRDYSIHKVLYGETWWGEITRYASERRGPVKRLSDKIIHRYEFSDYR